MGSAWRSLLSVWLRCSGPSALAMTSGLDLSREVAGDWLLQGFRCLRVVGPVGHDFNLVLRLDAQRQHAEDAFGVHPGGVAGRVAHPDLRGKPAGLTDEHRRRPGVQSDRVRHLYAQLFHGYGTPMPMSGSPFLTASAVTRKSTSPPAGARSSCTVSPKISRSAPMDWPSVTTWPAATTG